MFDDCGVVPITFAGGVLFADVVATPIGGLLVAVDARGALRAVDWVDHEARMMRLMARHCGAVELRRRVLPAVVQEAFTRYFAGELNAMCGLSVVTAGTVFQRAVWSALRLIPPGTMVSYATLAERTGRPRAVRAAGAANGANPVSIAIPCHRVVGRDGALVGYAGGLSRKRWLLAHEQRA
jgi:methylated-DNA-[protein]-cysteine S-methyltransferase